MQECKKVSEILPTTVLLENAYDLFKNKSKTTGHTMIVLMIVRPMETQQQWARAEMPGVPRSIVDSVHFFLLDFVNIISAY